MSIELKIPKRESPEPAKKKRRLLKISAKSTKSKFIIFLGDEGAILIHLKGNVVQSRQFVPDASQQNLAELQQALLKDVAASVMLVVDTMDQSYMQQTLPPVSSLSVNKLIKRRLDRDFSGNDIKGAILLGREKAGRKDWNFLMVALEKSPQLALWIDFIQQLPNRFAGIYLAAVEAENLVSRLEAGMKVDGAETEWKFFVSHNKVGGFRQVILRNNRIVFTRLAQPIGDSSAEVVAGSIEQEMLSTIEYMKRLSFSPQSKLAIYIVTSSGIKAAIDKSKFTAHTFEILTPFEISQYLGLEGAAQPTDQFGDVVLAATIGSSKKHVLRLVAPQTRKIDVVHQAILYQRVMATILILGMIGNGIYIGYEIINLITRNGEITDITAGEQRGLDNLRADISRSTVDVERASDLIDAYLQLVKEKQSPLPIMKMLESMLREPVWIKSIEWSVANESFVPKMATGAGKNIPLTPARLANLRNAPPPGKQPEPVMTLVLMLEFPSEVSDPRMFKVATKKILADFQALFEGFEVRYIGLDEAKIDTDRMDVISADEEEKLVAPKSLEVQLSIKGDLSLLARKSTEKAPVATSAPAIPQPIEHSPPSPNP